jgi:hypothetical protein
MKAPNVKIPNTLKYASALAYTLIASIFFAAVFAMQNDVPLHTYVGTSFLTCFIIQLIGGLAMKSYYPKGAFRNDSLVINDTTYAGTFAPYFILPALFGMDSYEKGILYVKDGIKKTHTIGKLDFSKPLQPRAVTPTQSGGDITVDGNTLTPHDVMVYQEFNPRDFESHWNAEDLSATLLTRQLPPTVENYISLLIVQRAFEQYEIGTWMASSQYANNVNVPSSDARYQLQFWDGFMKKFIADSGIYKTSSPVTLTSSNIGDKFKDLYTAAAQNNKALLTKATRYQRMKFIVSINTDLIYEDFLTTQPFKNNDTTEKGIRKYKGYEIVPVAGVPDNTIIFTEALAATDGNLWGGMNSILDDNFQLQRLFPNSEMFFFKMLAKFDVNYGFANKIFVYTTLVSNDFVA